MNRISAWMTIKTVFERQFARWQISLPEMPPELGVAGSIYQAGWTLNYRLVEENGEICLVFFTSHRMTNDRLEKIFADGRSELVDACWETFISGSPESERQYYEHNRQFYELVKQYGLG